MEIREYGQHNDKSLLLLPPKYMTGRAFELIIRRLSDWHIFCISYDGFEDSQNSVYESASFEAIKLANRLTAFAPLDIVFGHGLGACVAQELPDEFSRKFIYSGNLYLGTDATQSMLKMVMPKKHIKLLQKMDEPISQREIESVLHSALPYSVWKEFLPANLLGIQKESVEHAFEEDLCFFDNLKMDPARQKKTEFWYGSLQKFPLEMVEEKFPEAKPVCFSDYSRDDILFHSHRFQKSIEPE